MAQKRNPISLRLQTRLKGKEKRFASCWYTDYFYPQLFGSELRKRLYYGHLLEFGGSWGGFSESTLPESCISIQSSYRRSCILCIILDRRREDFQTSAFFQPRNKSMISSKMSTLLSVNQNVGSINTSAHHSIDTHDDQKQVFGADDDRTHNNVFSPHKALRTNSIRPRIAKHIANVLAHSQGLKQGITLFAQGLYPEKIDQALRVYENNYRRPVSAFTYTQNIDDYAYDKVEISPCISAVESFVQPPLKNKLFVSTSAGASNSAIPYSSEFASLHLLKAVSMCQNVEFCLYSIALLYKRRYSFTRIKEYILSRLANSEIVCGARIISNGRLGGRSKSAMRAKKQCAYFGKTPISMFSSRLAFAQTDVNTSFGKIGIKLWICYK